MSYPTESWPAAFVGAVVESDGLFNEEGGKLTGNPKGGDSGQTKVRGEFVESVPVVSTSFAIPFECLELGLVSEAEPNQIVSRGEQRTMVKFSLALRPVYSAFA